MKKEIPLIVVAVFSITLLINVELINAYADVTIYSVTGGTLATETAIECYSANRTVLQGEKATSTSSLINQTFNRMTIPLKTFSPSGDTVYVGVWNGTIAPTNANYKVLIASFLDTTLSTIYTDYTFDFNGYTIEENDVIGVFYCGSDSPDNVYIRRTTTDQFNGTSTHFTQYNQAGSTGWHDSVNSDLRMVLVDREGEPIGPTVGGINCALPENVNILVCRLGQQGDSIGSAGAFVIGNSSAGTGILGIMCGVGVVDCATDPDPKTNGLGILVFIASIFVVIGMFVAGLGKEGALKIPTFVYIIIIVSLSAFFTITNIIDPVFLILSVVALIALASPKLVSIFNGGSGNSFGSGSSA